MSATGSSPLPTQIAPAATRLHHGLTPAMNWTVGETVSIRLTESAGGGGATGNSAPNFRSASVSGNKLKVTYDEPLDEGSTPPGSSFRVRTMPDGGAVGNGPRGALSPASGGGPGNIGGTGTVRIDGATVTVTLDRPVAPGERLVVSYSRPGENAIRDPEGAEAAGFTARPATNVAAVTAVAVVSDAGDDDTYALGETTGCASPSARRWRWTRRAARRG